MKSVVEALIQTIASIEAADDSLIDGGFSVSLMEQLGHILQALDQNERREVVRAVGEAADRETDERRARIIRAIPESLGLETASASEP